MNKIVLFQILQYKQYIIGLVASSSDVLRLGS